MKYCHGIFKFVEDSLDQSIKQIDRIDNPYENWEGIAMAKADKVSQEKLVGEPSSVRGNLQCDELSLTHKSNLIQLP